MNVTEGATGYGERHRVQHSGKEAPNLAAAGQDPNFKDSRKKSFVTLETPGPLKSIKGGRADSERGIL